MKRVTDAQCEEMSRLVDEGLKYKAIGRRFNLAPSTAFDRVKIYRARRAKWLTARQVKVYQVCVEYFAENCHWPTVAELKVLSPGKSDKTVADDLAALVAKGYLTKTPGKWGKISVPGLARHIGAQVRRFARSHLEHTMADGVRPKQRSGRENPNYRHGRRCRDAEGRLEDQASGPASSAPV